MTGEPYLSFQKVTFALVAGEPSGDNYGANIILQLRKAYPNSKFVGVGGPKMLAAGLQSLMPIDALSVIGIVNVMKKLPQLYRAKNKLVKDLIKHNIDCYIGIDAPDFNLVVARNIKKIAKKKDLNIKTVQYISPTVWVWRPKRIYTVAKATDTVLCIFPFEQDIYNNAGISAQFIGHPLVDKLKDFKFNSLNIDANKTNIGVFPGSRRGEVTALAPVFLETIDKLCTLRADLVFYVPIINEKINVIWQEFYAKYSKKNLPIKIIKLYTEEYKDLSSLEIIKLADLILCASGTTTLEALLLNTPMVVAYKISKLNEFLIRLLIKVKYIAMPNILSDKLFAKKLVPEFVQDTVSAQNLANAVIDELKKYSNKDSSSWQPWYKLQEYMSAGQVNHDQAMLNAIRQVMG